MGFLIGSLIAAGVAAASALGSSIAGKKRQKRALAQQKDLNKESYEYGEMAADNALERQLVLNESENYQNKVEDAKEAGLSVGLLYGGGGIGGSGGGRASQGSGGNGVGVPEEQQQFDAAALGLEAQRIRIDQRLAKAEVEKTEAETENLKEQTATSMELTPIQNVLMNQQAMSQWIDNVRKLYENEGGGDKEYYSGDESGYQTIIKEAGNFNRQQAADIAKALSETEKNKAAAELNTEKKQGYWQELLNATKNANNDEIKAAAIKLAAEWQTGEYTNWKTWSEAAKQGIGALTDLIKIGK